jgi:GH18 family chitinase
LNSEKIWKIQRNSQLNSEKIWKVCKKYKLNNVGKGQYDMAKDLKTVNPDLKILLAIGGWNHGSEPFTDMVSTQSNIDQ